jgi:hypothetical protein
MKLASEAWQYPRPILHTGEEATAIREILANTRKRRLS